MKPTIARMLVAAALFSPVAALQAQEWAKARLDASPRHHEYVSLKHGDRTVQAFVVYPEVKTKAPVIILIHEIFGLSDWAKEMADELAGQGFIVVAPDLLTGFGPNGGGSDAFPSMDATTKAVSGLDAAVVNADLDAAADYGKKIPAANGMIAVTGFCWGGGNPSPSPRIAKTSPQPSSSTALAHLTSPRSPLPSTASTPATTPASAPQSPAPLKP